MKAFFFDLETTGLKFWKNGIHQMSGCIEVDGTVKETFNYKVAPNPAAEIEDEALKVGNVTREQILAYPPMKDIHGKLTDMLSKHCDKFDKTDKLFLIGYNNASFDNDFLRAFFKQCNDNYFGSWFWSSSIDVMVLASEALKNKRHTMIDFKLKTVARELGIAVDEGKLHDAAYDIELTRQIYHTLTDKK